MHARIDIVYGVFDIRSVSSHSSLLAVAFTVHFFSGVAPTTLASYSSIARLPLGRVAFAVTVVVVTFGKSILCGAETFNYIA